MHVDGSGRTDAGVHARGQVASVKLSKLYDTNELKESLNRYLPEDIRESDTCQSLEQGQITVLLPTKFQQ